MGLFVIIGKAVFTPLVGCEQYDDGNYNCSTDETPCLDVASLHPHSQKDGISGLLAKFASK